MERFFNTAGPMIIEDHYCIDPLSRIDWEDIQRLIRDKRYFVLHAPRQTGKTTTLLAMMDALNNDNRYTCAYANIEYVADLGLIRTRPKICISNRIYQEVIPRELTWSTQVVIPNQEAR